ncbi:sugar phosphate isomerase/epimerase [Lachnospiraceae bacterium OttesenSCG-928-D06]|nr:sugar phosphate isomerase/epimerase [Lachnospiraceae bacterium OttesenSCG-928-D06]
MGRIILSGFSDEICEDFSKQLEVIKSLGLSNIEIRGVDGKNISALSLEEVKEVKEKLDAANVCVSSLGSPIGKIGIKDDFEPHFQLFKTVVETAKTLGTPYIRMFSFYMPEGENPADYGEEVRNRLKKMIDYAEEQNVILLHENEKGIYGDSAERCKELFDAFYGPHFKGVFDFANFVECQEETQKAYELLKDFIVYIHIKDARMEEKKVVPPGDGDGKLALILKQFKDSGYSGYLSMEPHLAQFSGLKDLETNGKERTDGLDGLFAWKLALYSLKSILWDIDWRNEP